MTKHRHRLRQINILDATQLRCSCGLRFEWDVLRQRYIEILRRKEPRT